MRRRRLRRQRRPSHPRRRRPRPPHRHRRHSTSTTTSTTTTSIAAGVTDTTLPDGRPIAATAVFTDDQVTLTGAVPTMRLPAGSMALAVDYRLTPASVVDNADDRSRRAGRRRASGSSSTTPSTSSTTPTRSRPSTPQQLDRLVGLMGEFPGVQVHVVGNTDQRGEETRNFVVSQRRAEAVVDYLVAQGDRPARLTTQPAGESNPLSTEVERDGRRPQPAHRLRDLRHSSTS